MSIPGNTSETQHQADLFGWDQTNPIETETQLRDLLSGKRLVGELDLSRDGGVFQSARWVFLGATRTRDYSRLRHYPAVTAVFLVGEGGYCYDDGTFWPNIESLEDASPQERTIVGQAFEAAVRQLGLEDFSKSREAGTWMRYVTPILLHGGIPASCAPDAAQLILSDMRHGVQDGAELIDGVLRSTTRKTQLDRPLQRFFSHGGDFALDLVERMIAAVFDVNAIGLDVARNSVPELADDLGVPAYLIRALIDGGSVGRAARGRRTPRPQVRIDRYSCSGPYAVLPPVDDGEWLLTGSTASRYRALRRETHEVPLTPSRGGWTITLQSDAVAPKAHLNGHPDVSAYIFDAGGRLAREQRRLRGDAALVLAAKGVEVLGGDDTQAPLAEELPARGEPWHGWKLLSVDLTETDALVLRSEGAGLAARAELPVLRPPEGPAITSAPVIGVQGPMGCSVYADAPAVAEPQGTAASAWRVRWRSDDETSPPPTSLLDNLPHDPQGRSLAPRLPVDDAFCGTVEIVGPLGSDLRERVAVVRGLRVTVPDHVIGPDEAVEVTIHADCLLSCSNTDRGHSVTVQFEPGCESIEVSAAGMPMTVTVPRLSWAVSYRGAPPAGFSGDRHQIGLDDIESGEVESLLVRCGRPASISLELHGRELLHSNEPVQAAGGQGRWAFPLSQFRDTIMGSRLPNMSLRLRAEETHAEAAVVFARYQASELHVDVLPDIEGGEALLDVQWRENRRFRDRQLRLWSEHRPWEPPICEDIPDSIAGAFDCVVEAPPGPYLAEVAVRDDWIVPQRPQPGAAAVEVHVGSTSDSRSRLLSLRPAVASEALELAVAGHPRGVRMDPRCVTSARPELRQAISAASTAAVPFAVLGRLVSVASSTNGVLGEMLAEELVGCLPSSHLLRVTLAMMSSPTRSIAEPEILETLWQAEPVLAAVLDCSLDDRSSERWERFAGWVPVGAHGPEQPAEPVSEPLDEFPPARLSEVADALPPMGSLALKFSGYVAAALEMLANTWPDRKQLNDWMSAHTRVTTYTQRLSPSQRRQIEILAPPPGAAGWHRFPARLQAAAFQITDETASQTDHDAAANALLEAAEIAPLLTKRSLLTAAAHRAAALT